MTRRFEHASAMVMEKELFDGDADGELYGDQLLMAERVAAAQSGDEIRLGDVIKQIIACDNLERPVSLPIRISATPTLQRALPSKLNAHLPPFRPRIDSSDKMSRSDYCCNLVVRSWSSTTVITSRRGHRALASKTSIKRLTSRESVHRLRG